MDVNTVTQNPSNAEFISLSDFFKYYDSKIKEHAEALEILQSTIPKELLLPTAAWIRKYRSHRFANPDSIRGSSIPGTVDWTNANCKISRYFKVLEVTKGDPRRQPQIGSKVEQTILNFARVLDDVRERWGSPIGVTSWYRPLQVNLEIGGVEHSEHIVGHAADIYTMDGRDEEFEAWLDSIWSGGLGYGVRSGKGFTHVDLGEHARWVY